MKSRNRRRAFLFVLQAGFWICVAGAGEIDNPVVSVDGSAPSQQVATVTVTLGNSPAGTTIHYTTDAWVAQPVQVMAEPSGSLQAIVAVAAGDNHSLAIDEGSTVWAWGANSQGQLGNGDATLAQKTKAVSVFTDQRGRTGMALS